MANSFRDGLRRFGNALAEERIPYDPYFMSQHDPGAHPTMRAGDAGEFLAESYTPYGNYVSARDAKDDFESGRYGWGTANALAALPGLGIVGAAGRGTRKLLKTSSGISFIPHPYAKRNDVTLLVDPAKLDEAWKVDRSYYLPKEGRGMSEVEGRREGFAEFKKVGNAIAAPKVSLHKNGAVSFTDGRHRFAVLRDSGEPEVAITVPKSERDEFIKRFGKE